ncbi:hypothetical protein NPIL_386681 [Nephila pilipes]|uniref:Uncharacterized protein n=1 Tax=Nephila pilipes TaxID=299642 RepID=A0A8X6NB76_NEPPI|nr:hypothetical protein NPIL_386681 [Nephila pilipes]
MENAFKMHKKRESFPLTIDTYPFLLCNSTLLGTPSFSPPNLAHDLSSFPQFQGNPTLSCFFTASQGTRNSVHKSLWKRHLSLSRVRRAKSVCHPSLRGMTGERSTPVNFCQGWFT